jgi:hypothetical protein
MHLIELTFISLFMMCFVLFVICLIINMVTNTNKKESSLPKIEDSNHTCPLHEDERDCSEECKNVIQ